MVDSKLKLPKLIKGFTLWEIVIILAIMAILANIGIPAMASITQKKRSEVIARGIEDSFRFARSEAMRQNSPVYVCGAFIKVNQMLQGCTTNNTTQSGWNKGVLVFTDYYDKGIYVSNNDVKLTKFESASINSVKVVSKDLTYRVDPNSSISSPKYPNDQFFCFDITQKINGKDEKSILKLEKFGNGIYCIGESISQCAAGC
jgi:Tfp pilus assembly protein FimT